MSRRLICAGSDLVDGGNGVRFTVQREGGSEAAFAVRFRGQVHAYFNRCAHVPVELDWQPEKFFDDSGLYLICATHGALYAAESGHCLGGRCNGKGLMPVPVIEHAGNIYLIEEGAERV